MARFSIEAARIQKGTATLAGEELHHMRRVLRLRPGDRVTLFDDHGREHTGMIRTYHPDEGEVEILETYRPDRESSVEIALAQSLGKGSKMDWIVEKATELGVRTIFPVFSFRSVPQYRGTKAAGREDRWRKIALSAAKQSGRTLVPEVMGLAAFENMVRHSSSYDLKLLFWERAATKPLWLLKDERGPVQSVLVAIGPEGGFTEEEATLALNNGFQAATLGKRILRTETAAVVALSIVQFLWGDLGSRG